MWPLASQGPADELPHARQADNPAAANNLGSRERFHVVGKEPSRADCQQAVGLRSVLRPKDRCDDPEHIRLALIDGRGRVTRRTGEAAGDQMFLVLAGVHGSVVGLSEPSVSPVVGVSIHGAVADEQHDAGPEGRDVRFAILWFRAKPAIRAPGEKATRQSAEVADHGILQGLVGATMRPSQALATHRSEIRRIVEAHRARNPRVFGSVLRGEDTERSDIDILIDPTSETTLFDICAIRHELHQLLGVPVDVATPKALPTRFRSRVLAEAVPV